MKAVRLLAGGFFLLFFLYLSSCEEFFLKRTVSLISVSGTIEYNPEQSLLSGRIEYTIKNFRDTAIDEVYLISHPSVTLDHVFYAGQSIGVEQGIGYGYGIYRIKIPPLGSEKTATVSLVFKVQGPIYEDRFVITKNYLFFDSKKIWLPLPFAEVPNFNFSLTIRTPKNFYSVMGGKLTSEGITDTDRISQWDSEVPFPILTGSLFIAPLKRYHLGDVYLYSDNTQNVDKILEYASFSMTTLREKVGGYPFSEIHVVNQLSQYKGMEMFIDGEYFANCIHVSPSIFSFAGLQNEKQVIYSAIPFLPKNSELKLFEILAHEISHAYFSTLIRFEDDSHLLAESMTEYLGSMVLKVKFPNLYDKVLERNRFILQNLFMKNQTENPIWDFFCAVNTLGYAFDNTGEKFFKFVEILYKKYQFTRIRLNELITTAKAMQPGAKPKNGYSLINTDAMALLKPLKMYNLSLDLIEAGMTNQAKHPKYVAILQSTFPIPVSAILIYTTVTNVFSNFVTLDKELLTNLSFDDKIISLSLESPSSVLEYCLYDNRIDQAKTPIGILNEQVNLFYQNRPFDQKILAIGTEDPTELKVEKEDVTWKTLATDRKLSASIHTNITIVFDSVTAKDNEMYVQAFKYINGKPFSYVVVKFLKTGKKYQAMAILDPSL
ncbi:MAG: hypothetical protein HPY53_07940 [Brevinematales bacterium]|nr:hypothetical protein [Brevinematales bacterium]